LKKLKHESVFEFINDPVTHNRIENSLRHKEIDFLDREGRILHKSRIATFKIKAPIFTIRQFVRHRCFSYLERSRRYVKDSKIPFEFYNFGKSEEEKEYIERFYHEAILTYKKLLNLGYPPEKARGVIPVAEYTEIWVQGDLKCLENFFNLRLKKDAQEEIRIVAKSMLRLINKYQKDLYNNLAVENKDDWIE
jgi:flavin-dependent thymidylate synthase